MICEKTIVRKNNFLIGEIISALINGDNGLISSINQKIKDEYSEDAGKILVYLKEYLNSLEESGFARKSNTGWWTAENSKFGRVQWKVFVETDISEIFYFRVNSKPILEYTIQASLLISNLTPIWHIKPHDSGLLG